MTDRDVAQPPIWALQPLVQTIEDGLARDGMEDLLRTPQLLRSLPLADAAGALPQALGRLVKDVTSVQAELRTRLSQAGEGPSDQAPLVETLTGLSTGEGGLKVRLEASATAAEEVARQAQNAEAEAVQAASDARQAGEEADKSQRIAKRRLVSAVRDRANGLSPDMKAIQASIAQARDQKDQALIKDGEVQTQRAQAEAIRLAAHQARRVVQTLSRSIDICHENAVVVSGMLAESDKPAEVDGADIGNRLVTKIQRDLVLDRARQRSRAGRRESGHGLS